MSVSDQDLLRRFAATGDQPAFAALVERHAPLVLGACRRVLGDVHDAEDASQAVFLILAKKAAAIDASATLAPWLYRVAIDVARDLGKARRARERRHREVAAMPRHPAADNLGDELDAALRQLPERERSAIVLFHLEGRPLAEVARLVSRPVGTVGVWLHRGRERLGGLLRRRGVALSTAAVLSGLAGMASAEIPAGFVAATASAAAAFITTGTVGAVATPAASLALKGCHAMKLVALFKSSVLAATLTAVVGTVGVIAVAAESAAKPAKGGKGNPNAAMGSPEAMPSPERSFGWRGDGSGRYPAATPPTTWERKRGGSGYETKNIIWTTALPNVGVSMPIVVGERVFITTEPNDLVCLDKKTGNVLWIRSNSEFEGMAKADRGDSPVYAEKLEPLAAQLAKADEAAVATLNSAKDASGVAGAMAKKRELEKQIVDAQMSIDKKKFERYWAQAVFGFAGPTPVSDGKVVCAFFTTGVSACYDLDGNRKWIARGPGGGAEHGNFASPVLCANHLVVWANEMRAYDIATGKVAWSNPAKGNNSYGSLFRMQVGGEPVVGFQFGWFNRVSDGKAIWGNGIFGDATPTPIVEGDVLFADVGYPRNAEGLGFKAFKIPTADSGKPTPAYTFKTDWAADEVPTDPKTAPFDRGFVASPLFVDGLIYRITQGGGLIVNDATTGNMAYRKVLPLKPKTHYWEWAGTSASPTLAGKYIYLMDNQGTTVVIAPGPAYKQVAVNVIEELKGGKDQEQNVSTPVFEGTRMYYRTPSYLYCVGEK